MSTEPRQVVGPDGRPAQKSDKCPRCAAGKEKRVASAGFGQPHDVCSSCGYDFEESTC